MEGRGVGLCWAHSQPKEHGLYLYETDERRALKEERQSPPRGRGTSPEQLPHLPPGGKACLLIRKHDHFTPPREIKGHVRALARNHPEEWNLQRHVSPTTTNYPSWHYGVLVRIRVPILNPEPNSGTNPEP